MSLKFNIILMTAFAVISDAVLIPFYPQFFLGRYGVESAVHVGAYVAAISIAVMCTLPFWARLSRRVEPLHLLVYTQFAAGCFSVLSLWAQGVAAYWVLSMLMFICKSSYLLMYPYLMRLEPPEKHAGTIGLLSVVVHFGAISGAVVGGFVMETWGPSGSILAMAAGDFFQMAVCFHLIRSGRMVRVNAAAAPAEEAVAVAWFRKLRIRLSILRLALVMLVFDAGVYLVRPFFAVYWQQVSGQDSELLAGAAFAIPGAVAVLALFINARIRASGGRLPNHTSGNLLLGIAGLLLQAAPHVELIVIGRCLYGWAVFQIVVKLDVFLFRMSTPQHYAQDYSITNFFQNLGVLLSSFAAGAVVERYGLSVPFVLGAIAFALAAMLARLLLAAPAAEPQEASVTVGEVPARAD